MKRFTEAAKWGDPWFRKLPVEAKAFWSYICDNCDHSGVIDADWEAASFMIGKAVDPDILKHFTKQVFIMENGKLLIVGFIEFQYGKLSRDCKPHSPVYTALARNCLTVEKIEQIKSSLKASIAFGQNADSLSKATRQEEDKTREGQEGESEGIYHKDSRTVLHLLNEAAGRHYRETDANLKFISARLSEPGVDLGGMRQMIGRQCKKWNGTNMADYLRPETLFNKTKFDGYYAARQEPINENSSINHQPSPDRNAGTANAGKASQYSGLGKVVAT